MSDVFNTIRNKNPHIRILSVNDAAFSKYGKIVTGYDFSPLIDVMKAKAIPEEGNIYVGKDDDLMACAIADQIALNFYGSMPIQIGYCNGGSTKLNALEYHKGSEIDIAVTNLVLLLGDIRDIKDNTYPSSAVEAFFVPAGTACELYGTTLHFAPCKVEDSGFKSIIILPDSTNLPLDPLPEPRNTEDRLLWMRNKWLIAHPESVPASKGACAGITGDNIEIFY
ncbi:MAG TPA: DUF4867 family protein [Candidatus Scybalocola faecipullorum]|nr:DUF4867 family protein [Candidatus Scybalocola faecipullorum]